MAPETHRGLVIILTGDGKGKTTAALGLALRAIGHGMRVTVVQFLKDRVCGEHRSAERLAPQLQIRRMGLGFVPPSGGEARREHRQAADEALREVRRLLAGGACEMVVADEVLTALGLGLVEEEAVEALLEERPAQVHLVLTGRGATERLLARADLVTEMREVKHPHDGGAAAEPGIEF
jgi:cob(I)alamin adenosyltransferase